MEHWLENKVEDQVNSSWEPTLFILLWKGNDNHYLYQIEKTFLDLENYYHML
jgi:hypothetical protein